MPTYVAPLKDFKFLLSEFLPLEQFTDVPGIGDLDQSLIEPILEEGARFCQEALFPLNQSGDEEGCTFDSGTVRMPKGHKEAYELYCQSGWPSLACDPDYGGQGLPHFLNMPVVEMICSANFGWGLTPGLSEGAYRALTLHASDELKQKYLPPLVEGRWTGVMCLTEPQAGTDLGLIRTKADPNPDGSYSITGNKIFISAGEHDMTENILHLVLARLPDAPAGTKGISLFLVSKFHVNDDGTLGERNGVQCSGIEEKMGIHASPTCVMNYDGATGYLLSQPNKGLSAMFTMMNAARLFVGVQGLGVAEVAYQNAVAYAKERLQSRAPKGPVNPDKAADPIIVHPDVRRMLLTQKSFTEGARALVMETALMLDVAHSHPDLKEREKADDYVQIITPIVKAYLTDMGSECANHALQVFGGYGYIREYGMEQYVRDARIAQIYEGTNGIQALDLIGRKLPAHTGRYLRQVFYPMDAFINAHADNPAMQEFTRPLKTHMEYLQKASLWLGQAGLANPDDAAAGACEYLRMFAVVYMAYLWARMAAIALEKLEAGDGDAIFYQSKLETARFTMAKVLPQALSLLMSITAGSKSVMAMSEEGFDAAA